MTYHVHHPLGEVPVLPYTHGALLGDRRIREAIR